MVVMALAERMKLGSLLTFPLPPALCLLGVTHNECLPVHFFCSVPFTIGICKSIYIIMRMSVIIIENFVHFLFCFSQTFILLAQNCSRYRLGSEFVQVCLFLERLRGDCLCLSAVNGFDERSLRRGK